MAGGCAESGRPQEAHGSDRSTAAVRRSSAAMSRLHNKIVFINATA